MIHLPDMSSIKLNLLINQFLIVCSMSRLIGRTKEIGPGYKG